MTDTAVAGTPPATSFDRVDKLYAAIAASLDAKEGAPKPDAAIQPELAEWLILLKDLADPEIYEENIGSAEIAVKGLLGGTAGVDFSKTIRAEIDRATWAVSHWWIRAMMLCTGSPAVAQLGGAICTFLLFAVISALLFYFQVVVAKIDEAELPFSLFCVAAAATVGSLVSILIGLQENKIDNRKDLVLSFVFGIFRPIIGVGFAIFVFLIVKSGYVEIEGLNKPDTVTNSPDFVYLMSAIAFVCGFSERLGRDIVSRVEGKVGGPHAGQKP